MTLVEAIKKALWRRKLKQTPVQNAEPTLEEQAFALFDQGDFLAASNLLEHEFGGNAYYEYAHRWRQARGKA